MKTKLITIVFTAIAILAGAAYGYASASDPSTASAPTTSSCMPVTACTKSPAYVPSSTTIPPVVTTAPRRTTPKQTEPTTSTTYPAPRPAELEARIPDSDAETAYCEAVGQPIETCQLPESQGMSESDLNGTDYDQ